MHAIFFNPPLETNFLGHQIKEIYKDGLYEPFLRGKTGLTIVDIGGNIGLTSYYFSQFAKDVYMLEPAQGYFDLANQMLSYNGVTNVRMIKKALYIQNGKFPFWHNKSNQTMSSLNGAIHDGTTPPEEVDTITLDKLFEENQIEHVNLLKMDCEGSEYEIFGHDSFGNVADKIDVIVGEIHSWANRNPNQLRESLQNRGFKFEWKHKNDHGEPELFIATK